MSFQYIKHTRIIAMAALLAGAVSGCTPESSDKELGPLPTASFTAEPLATNPNKIVVSNTTPGGFLFEWMDDDGNKSKREKDTFAYFAAGEYRLKFTVFTSGGYDTAVQKITIAQNAQTKDILKGGDMEAGSEQFWTVLNTGGDQTAIKFENGKLNFSNTGNSNGAIYQEVNVTAGKYYVFSGLVSGDGATDSWFEVYFGVATPIQGTDYSGTKFNSLNTWSGCGKLPFVNKDLAIFGCDGAGVGKKGIMKFNTTGKVYLVIKAGSANNGTLGTGGISIDDVKFQEEI
jgi:PKD repeat protein